MNSRSLPVILTITLVSLVVLFGIPLLHTKKVAPSPSLYTSPIPLGVSNTLLTPRCDLLATLCTVAGGELQGSSPELQGISVPVIIQISK